MKALIYDGVETLGYRDVPDAAPREGEHLVRIEAVGICGSDMHAYLGHDARRPAPLILGHEAAGTVVGGPLDGQRVTVNPLVNCGKCLACNTGRENLCPDRQIISMPPPAPPRPRTPSPAALSPMWASAKTQAASMCRA